MENHLDFWSQENNQGFSFSMEYSGFHCCPKMVWKTFETKDVIPN